MMDDRFIWPCLNKANEIAQIIETVEDKHASMIEGDLAELKITINLVRSTLVPFLTSPVNDVAFDVCVQGVKHTVDQIRKLMDQLDAVVPTPEWLNRKIALYKLDFLLKQKLDQFSTLFPQDGPSKGANMILDPDAREFWKTSFGEKVPLNLNNLNQMKCISFNLGRVPISFILWSLPSAAADASGAVEHVLPRAREQAQHVIDGGRGAIQGPPRYLPLPCDERTFGWRHTNFV